MSEKSAQEKKDDAQLMELTASLLRLCKGRPGHIAGPALARALARIALSGVVVDGPSYEVLSLWISCAATDLTEQLLVRLRASSAERPS